MSEEVTISHQEPAQAADVQMTADQFHLLLSFTQRDHRGDNLLAAEVGRMVTLTNAVRQRLALPHVHQDAITQKMGSLHTVNRNRDVSVFCAEVAHGWRDEFGARVHHP